MKVAATMKIYTALILLFHLLGTAQTPNENDKVLHIKEIVSDRKSDLEKASRLLEQQTDLNSVAILNWDSFSYRPDLKFRIAHSNNEIWLKFYVTEKHILAQRTEPNSATHRDSCVEFFIDPEQDGNYYNFEFNCIGTTHLAYGPDRHQREFVNPDTILREIKITSSLGDRPFEEKSGRHTWEMTVIIPAKLFVHNHDISLKKLVSKANFYKCGDDTSEKHYLSWNPVGSERPDFHRPEFFGKLIFE